MSQSAFGQSDKERLIQAARFLEEKPLDKEAKNIRNWAFVYAAETDDVTVVICGAGGPFLDKKAKYGSEMMIQYTIAMAAFKLQNPANTDENAAQLAGVESALRTYQNILKEKPKATTKTIDELVTKQNNGELAKYVADADCGKQ